MALETPWTAWDNAETNPATGVAKLSVARDEGIKKEKVWKQMNNSAQKNNKPRNIGSAGNTETDTELHPTATEIGLTHVNRHTEVTCTSKDSSKQ